MSFPHFYVQANLFCILEFIMLLIRSLKSIDRQAKQRVFDNVIISHIFYFLFDSYWALLIYNIIPLTHIRAVIANIGDNVALLFLTCFWFVYVEMDQGEEYINIRERRRFIFLPAILSIIADFVFYIFFPELVFTQNYRSTLLSTVLFMLVPLNYVGGAMLRSIVRAFRKKNVVNRKRFVLMAIYPGAVIFFGLVQALSSLEVPIFCFSCTLLMMYVYLISQDSMVRLDPLTGLNNRAQLNHYVTQDVMRNEPHYLLMIDLNDFKKVNDRYGHIEGDKAIVMAAEAIRKAVADNPYRPFICRYGGDEFLVIIRTDSEKAVIELKEKISEELNKYNESGKSPYRFSASMGYAPFMGDFDDFKNSLELADEGLYEEKEEYHRNNDD